MSDDGPNLWWGEAPELPNSIAGSMAVTTLDVMHLCAAEPRASTTPDYLYHHSSFWKISPRNGHSSGVAAKPALTGFIIMYRRFSSAPSHERM
jgi:hypothetical protein